MNVLVTGGAGYVGSALVPHLLDRDHEVTVVDKCVFGADAIDPRATLIVQDVRKVDFLSDRFDAIIHLAGISNDPTAEFNPQANMEINTEASIRLAWAAREVGIRRFIYASSCSVYYSPTPTGDILTEESPIDPQAPYSKSKYLAEKGILALADDDRFSPACLRKGTIYGQSRRMRYDLVVNAMVKDAFTRRSITVHAGGRSWRPLLRLDEAVNAYTWCLEAPRAKIHGRIFNAVTRNWMVLSIAQEVRRAIQRHHPGFQVELNVQEAGPTRSYKVNDSWLPKIGATSSSRGITADILEMWDEVDALADPDHPIYYNLRWIEQLLDMKARLAAMEGNPL